MNFKKLLVLLLAMAMVVALASCKEKCKGHVDADDDLKCDNCGEAFDDGEEVKPILTVDFTFKVKLSDGTPVPGVQFSLLRGDKTITLVSGSDGNITANIEPGSYAIEYDFDTLPMNCLPETEGVKVEEGKTSADVIIIDNTPDGSSKKPYYIQENNTDITVEAGQEIFYIYRGSTEKTLQFNVEGIEINYNGETYKYNDGRVSVLIVPEIGVMTRFSIKNTSDESISTTMQLIARAGTYENPFALDELTAELSIKSGETVYYSWIADKSGLITVSNSGEGVNVNLTKILENDVPIISESAGSGVVTLEISEGERVIIAVSLIGDDVTAPISISFSGSVGTAD